MGKQIQDVIIVLCEGGIIAYPTEGVFGLGCDPDNQTAVLRLLKIKQRKMEKGLILIAANWDQVAMLVQPRWSDRVINIIDQQQLTHPITWILPATKLAPKWIVGNNSTIAIRVTKHAIAKKLCQKFHGPIVSTSANLAGLMPAVTVQQVKQQFGAQIDFVVNGQVGKLGKPTEIRDVRKQKIVRL